MLWNCWVWSSVHFELLFVGAKPRYSVLIGTDQYLGLVVRVQPVQTNYNLNQGIVTTREFRHSLACNYHYDKILKIHKYYIYITSNGVVDVRIGYYTLHII